MNSLRKLLIVGSRNFHSDTLLGRLAEDRKPMGLFCQNLVNKSIPTYTAAELRGRL